MLGKQITNPETNESYFHIKFKKEVDVVIQGVIKVKCWNCERIHTIKIQ